MAGAGGPRGDEEPRAGTDPSAGLDASIVVVEPDASALQREQDLAHERVVIAAYAGHPPSQAALGEDAPRRPHTVDAWLLGLADWDIALVPLAGLSIGGLALEALERDHPALASAWRARFDLARAFVESPGYEAALALVEATRAGLEAPAGDGPGAAAMRVVEQCALLAMNALGARYLTEVAPLVAALVSTAVEAGLPVPALVAAVSHTVTAAVLGES